MLRMIVTDPHMNGAPGNPGPPIDYGDDVKRAVKELEKVVPKEHLMAGMMGWDRTKILPVSFCDLAKIILILLGS